MCVRVWKGGMHAAMSESLTDWIGCDSSLTLVVVNLRFSGGVHTLLRQPDLGDNPDRGGAIFLAFGRVTASLGVRTLQGVSRVRARGRARCPFRLARPDAFRSCAPPVPGTAEQTHIGACSTHCVLLQQRPCRKRRAWRTMVSLYESGSLGLWGCFCVTFCHSALETFFSGGQLWRD